MLKSGAIRIAGGWLKVGPQNGEWGAVRGVRGLFICRKLWWPLISVVGFCRVHNLSVIVSISTIPATRFPGTNFCGFRDCNCLNHFITKHGSKQTCQRHTASNEWIFQFRFWLTEPSNITTTSTTLSPPLSKCSSFLCSFSPQLPFLSVRPPVLWDSINPMVGVVSIFTACFVDGWITKPKINP